MNFISDYAKIIRDKYNFDENMTDDSVLLAYLDRKNRILPVKKWNVHRAPDLNSQIPENVRPYIDEIEKKASNGEPLDAHHSTRIDECFFKDGMLFDWGIFHLHPGHGDKNTSSEFVNRAGALLFVYPNNNDLYFIHLGGHKSFSCKSILEKLCTAWPNLLDSKKASIIPSYTLESDEEIADARRSGVNCVIEINGNYYTPPGGGITVSGHSAEVTDELMRLKNELRHVEGQIKSYYVKLSHTDKALSSISCDIKLVKESREQFCIKDLTTNRIINYNRSSGKITIEQAR